MHVAPRRDAIAINCFILVLLTSVNHIRYNCVVAPVVFIMKSLVQLSRLLLGVHALTDSSYAVSIGVA